MQKNAHGHERLLRLLRGWEEKTGPRPRRLAESIEELVAEGELYAGYRLPSERSLAAALLVSRGTVTSAFDLLRSRGVITSQAGAGSRVRPASPMGSAGGDARLSSFIDDAGLIDLSSGAVSGLPLTVELARSAFAMLPGLLHENGYAPSGIEPLREAIALYHQELGQPTSEANVVVTSGSQQALQLVSRAFITRGDVVLVEDPTYRGALDMFAAHGAKLVPIPVTRTGPDIAALERLIRQLNPRLVYIIPVAHNPHGHTIGRASALNIGAVVDASNAVLVEDWSTRDLLLPGTVTPPPIANSVDGKRSVVIGSLSKAFWGGLRIGWIRASREVSLHIKRSKADADLGCSMLSQLAAVSCLERITDARIMRTTELTHKLNAAKSVLKDVAPDWYWESPSGGGGLWIRLPGGSLSSTELSLRGRRDAKVSVTPGPVFSPVGSYDDHLRIPFEIPSSILEVSLRRLHALNRFDARPVGQST